MPTLTLSTQPVTIMTDGSIRSAAGSKTFRLFCKDKAGNEVIFYRQDSNAGYAYEYVGIFHDLGVRRHEILSDEESVAFWASRQVSELRKAA